MLKEVWPIQLLIPFVGILVVVEVWDVLQDGLLSNLLGFSQRSIIQSTELGLLLLFKWCLLVIRLIIWDKLGFLVESNRQLRFVLRLHLEINLILIDISRALLGRDHLFLKTIWSQLLCKNVYLSILLLNNINSLQQICDDLRSHRRLNL